MSATYSHVAIQTDDKPFDCYPAMQEHFLFNTKEPKANSLSAVASSNIEASLTPLEPNTVYVQSELLNVSYSDSPSGLQDDEVPPAAAYVDLQPSEFADFPQSQIIKLRTFVRKDPSINHDDDDLYICRYCSKKFTSKCSLSHHYRKIHPDQPTIKITKNGKEKIATLRNICDVCNAKFPSSTLLNYHYRIHTNERLLECKVCGKTFRMALNLKIHERIHTNERPYACPECDKTFKSQPALYRHKLVHTGEKPYACTICGKSFTQSNSVKLHVRTVHLKQPAPYKKKTKPCICRAAEKSMKKEHDPLPASSMEENQEETIPSTSNQMLPTIVSIQRSNTAPIDPIPVKTENLKLLKMGNSKFITIEINKNKPVIHCVNMEGQHVLTVNDSENPLQNL